jgi:hypothetical protein
MQICERLPAVIADNEARAIVLNLPRRREAAVRHSATVERIMNVRKVDGRLIGANGIKIWSVRHPGA